MTYKRFQPLRTSISLIFISFFLMLSPVQASDALFTIQGVEIDAKADNALAARELAFAEAQVKAFGLLVERLAAEGDDVNYTMPDSISLSAMIQDYEVTSEKLSSVRYVGVYTFRFKSKAVKKYFSGALVDYTDIKSDPILILPFYKKGDEYSLWSYTNSWREAWDRVDTFKGLVPIIVPVGDIQDVNDIGDDNSQHYDPKKLNNLLNRYGAKEAVIAVAIPDSGFGHDLPDADTARGSVSINLYQADKFGPKHVTQFFVIAQGDKTRGDLLDEAVKNVQKTLSHEWKNKTVVADAQKSDLVAHIAISSLGDWISKQKILKSISMINDLKVESLTSRKAIIKMSYTGDESRLKLALKQQKMALRPIFGEGNVAPAYELSEDNFAEQSYTQSF